MAEQQSTSVLPAELLVQSPQPACNPNQTQNQKQLFLQEV